MIIEVYGFPPDEADFLKDALNIRNIVFVQEQNVDKRIEYDGLEEDAIHYLVHIDGKPAATARWRETDKGIKLERFAVLKEHRGKGLAGVLLKFILSEVKPAGKRIYLHAQKPVENFYAFYGFKRVGEPFTEADILHYLMEYDK
jgi:predicted GNAT family N-acyltransferase